jgi:hypothetical protein
MQQAALTPLQRIGSAMWGSLAGLHNSHEHKGGVDCGYEPGKAPAVLLDDKCAKGGRGTRTSLLAATGQPLMDKMDAKRVRAIGLAHRYSRPALVDLDLRPAGERPVSW